VLGVGCRVSGVGGAGGPAAGGGVMTARGAGVFCVVSPK
jgi:hypothetical protein